MNPENLREKDIAVLQALQEGASNTSEIKKATTLTLREINYSINEKSLEQLGLVEVNRSKGRQQGTWKPKTIELTDQGLQVLAEHGADIQYQDMSREELIQTVHQLEERLDRLETVFKHFRSRVMAQIQ
jgi:DNA-binding MarR family transcriptional regulator